MWFSYTCIFLFQFLFTYRFLQNTEYSSLCYTVGHYWLSILHIVCVHPQSISCVWLFVTSWTAVHQTPLSMGFSGQEYWNGLPFPTLRDLPDTGIELVSLALAGKLFTSETPGKPAYSSEYLLFPKILIYLLPLSLRRDTKQNIYEKKKKKTMISSSGSFLHLLLHYTANENCWKPECQWLIIKMFCSNFSFSVYTLPNVLNYDSLCH